MRQAVMTAAQPAVTIPVPKKRIVRIERPNLKFPSRRTGGPVHISTILDQITEISRHPDRNRLLAELFKG
ncbi:hypothetical protein [Bacteroides uniformis]|uniref:Uncharacterized protein n=1 Tax=Bacteroides uniformis dnLKV2 TaxID=1235787 RepID=R9HQR2_BACUN|nr:hypothetical protein [Bacteroides uniformis]EOS06383.1 hypothetical protein C801_03249 [Bacteroides uniformis dnLKV2]